LNARERFSETIRAQNTGPIGTLPVPSAFLHSSGHSIYTSKNLNIELGKLPAAAESVQFRTIRSTGTGRTASETDGASMHVQDDAEAKFDGYEQG
jgi:hypothetical protein